MNRSGWAYGERIPAGSPWLTILGSAHQTPELYPDRESAERALDQSGLRQVSHLNMTVAHVTEEWHGGVSGNGIVHKITDRSPR